MKIEEVVIGKRYKISCGHHIFNGMHGKCIDIQKDDNAVGLDLGAETYIYVRPETITPLSIHASALEKFGENHQVFKLIEEMAELTQALLKKHHDREHNAAEEIADVQIVLDQMKILYPEWKTWEQIKLKKLESIL